MGHLINPIALRLSINHSWNSNWSLINNFNYNIIFKKDYTLFTYLNWFIHEKDFLFNNFIVSHYKIYRVHNKNYVNLYYYVSTLEEFRYNKLCSFLLRSTWYKYRNFYPRFNRKKLWGSLIFKLHKWNLNSVKEFIANKSNINDIKNKKEKLINNYLESLRTSKKRLYSYLNFSYGLEKKNNLYRIKWAHKRRINKFLFKFFCSYLFFFCLNSHFNYFLKNLYIEKNYYYFNIYNLNFNSVSVNIITTYISCRLQQRYSLNWVLRPIFRDLNKKIKSGFFLGYKLLCAGRFTRNQIATYTWDKKGSLKLNKFSSLVKYSQTRVRLKFGLGGIKLWIHYGLNKKNKLKNRWVNLIYPKFCPFKFLFLYKEHKFVLFLNYWSHIYNRIFFWKRKKMSIYNNFIKFHIYNILYYLKKKIIRKKKFINFVVYNIKLLYNNKLTLNYNKPQIGYNNFKIFNKKLINKFYVNIYS